MNISNLKQATAFPYIIAAFVLTLFCPQVMWAQFIGDVNDDGNVTIVDALMVAQYCIGLNPAGFQSFYADADGNGSITIVDALMVAQYSVGLITEFPAGTTATVTPSPGPGSITLITLKGSFVSINGGGAAASGSMVTISSAGSYDISGTLYDGQILVDTEDAEAVTLILSGVDITCSRSAPLAIMGAKEVFLVLSDNTCNYITDTLNYVFPAPAGDEPNAALFSKDDLTISGNGTLIVSANYNDGIATKDGLAIQGGNINVTAIDDGIRGKDYIHLEGGNIIVDAGGDGLKSDDDKKGTINIENGAVNITSGGDAMQAEIELRATGGNVTLTAGGGSNTTVTEDESAKGLKGLMNTVIYGGTFNIDTADDSIHSNGNVTINGGTFSIATGDDGIHADETLQINGGDIYIMKSYEGIESKTIIINDGNINVTADDDGINASGGQEETTRVGQPGEYYLYINGGYIVLNITAVTVPGSSGGDGLDCNGYMYMTGGTVIVHGGTNIDGAIDYDGSFTMTGGLLVGAGTSTMAMGPGSDSVQNSLLYNFDTRQGGTLFNIQSSDGAGILTFKPDKEYSSVTFSSPQLTTGTTYNVYFGGSATGTVSDGLYRNGSYTPGTLGTSFTVSSNVTRIGGGFHGFQG